VYNVLIYNIIKNYTRQENMESRKKWEEKYQGMSRFKEYIKSECSRLNNTADEYHCMQIYKMIDKECLKIKENRVMHNNDEGIEESRIIESNK